MAAIQCAHTENHSGDRISDTQVLADTIQCLDCGDFTDMHGRALPKRPKFSAPSFQERKARGEVQ